MKEKRNIKNIFQIVFTFFAFFIFGAINVDAETVTKEVNELNDFIKLMNNSEGVDTIKLGADIVSTDETLADVYTSFIWNIRGDKVLDLNGHTITGIVDRVFKLYYYGDYTVKIIDSSKSCTSAIINNYNGYNGGIFTLNSLDSGRAANKTLIIDGVNLTENGIDNPKSIYNSKENSTLDTLIVKNSNIKSVTLALWFDKYEFSNITLKPSDVNKQTRLLGEAETTVKVSDILGVDQEIVYDKKINEAPTYEKFVVEDTNTLIKDIYTQNNNEEDERSIVIRYKKGFEVSDVEFDDVVYGYSPIDKEILIKNIGVSKATIESVKSSDENFIVTGVENKDVEAGSSDNSWKIKPREGLDAGVYTADIKVITADGNTYTSTVKITVNKKDLTDLGISLNSPYAYGSAIEPELTGTTELGSNEYKFVYSTSDGEELLDKPFKLGEYKVTLKVNSKNYNASDVTVDFSIVQKNINTTIKVEGIKDYTFKRIAIYQDDLVVKDGDKKLSENFDYKLEYSDNIDAGEATITINPVSGSNYTFDSFTETFKIKPADLLDEFVSLEKDTYRYTGSNINPPVTLRDTVLSVYLTERLDYEIRYENNVEKGNEAKVIITGKGNYKGTVTKLFSIVDKEVQEISFTDSEITKTYGEGVFTIEANHTKGDGVVKYTSSNTDVAVVNESTGEVTIKGAGPAVIKATASETDDYAEASASYKLNVNKLKINFTAIVDSKEYDGNNKANVSEIDFIGVKSYDTLVKDTDYTVSALFSDENYGLSKDVTVKITLKDTKTANNYELENDTYNAKASITGRVIKGEWVKVAEDTYTYNGSSIEPVVTVKDPTGETVITLTKGTHYRVEYSNNINAGTGKIKITGIGNYSGEIEKDFTINKKSITPTIDDIPSVIYNGSEHRPNLVVKDGSTTLIKGTDYNVEYSNNLRAGSAYAEISSVPTSNYTFGTTGKNFTIERYKIKESDVTLEYTSVVGDGNAKRPNVTVKMGNEVIPPIEYNVDYEDNTSIGTASVIVTIKADSDDFTGTVTTTFEIVDKTLLTISGISNQQVVYTGSPVVLNGTLTVSNEINPQNLTIKWYKGSEEITRPTDAGEYKVVYSYEDDDYIGSLTVDFEITKKESVIPTLNDYSAVVGDKLSSITLPNGFKWRDGNEVVTSGSKKYNATYTENNDTTNYTTKNVEVNVYGKVKVNLTTSVNGVGGTISSSKNNILEGTTETITLSPSVGFEISKVEVNGIDKTSSINNNKLDIVIGNSDVNVVVTYKAIQYTITINDLEHVTINPSGIIKVDYNTNKTFTIMAELGYKLVSVKVNGVEMISSIVNDELTLENILSDTEIVVVVERNIHKVIEGANQKYIINESKEARFKIDAKNYSFERGGSVYVDGLLVDPSNYTSEDGNIIVLKKKYLDNLSEGEHTLKVVFVDGEASTTFSVVKLNKENPKTGDNIVIYILTGIVSTLGLAGVYFYRRKQTN